jgi:hypothetical protein
MNICRGDQAFCSECRRRQIFMDVDAGSSSCADGAAAALGALWWPELAGRLPTRGAARTMATGRKARRPQRTTGWMACTWVPPVRGAGMKGESTRRARGDRRMEMDGAGGVPRMVTIRVLRAHWLRRAASLSPSPGLPPIYEEAEAQSCRFALLSSVVANKGGWPLEGSDPLPFLFVPST